MAGSDGGCSGLRGCSPRGLRTPPAVGTWFERSGPLFVPRGAPSEPGWVEGGWELAVHVGTSGWSYPHWDGVLYAPGTAAGRRLELYAARFGTAELNASFYRWPRTATFAGWRRRLPAGLQLSVKASRGLTHAKKLYAPEVWIDRIAACWHELGARRGVVLVQLAPTHVRDDARGGQVLGHSDILL